MKNESTGGPRRGLPAWVVAASVGVALASASAIVVRSLGGPSPRFVPGLSGEDVVAADDGDAEPEPVGVADAPASPAKPRVAAILASLPAKDVAPSPAVAAPKAIDARATAIERAKREMAACRAKYRSIHDYACTFHKRERIDGKLTRPHVMTMRVRTEPHGVYLKFLTPDAGREAIFEPARNSGKIVYHDVGLGRLIAGTLLLDPKGSLAMEENRHPINDAGIGNLIETLAERWAAELDPSESVVEVHPHARVADRACMLIETIHPETSPTFMFHKVKVYIDREHGLPIRFEAYDWPKSPGGEAELVEEYTYADLKTDVGLTDLDFDASNPRYAFGRF
jgi:hypothetical protein